MKPARFILNTDYTTVVNTGHIELSITIPDDFYAPVSPSGDYYTIGITSASIGDKEDSFSTYFTSSTLNYASLGNFGYIKPQGASTTSGTDELYAEITITGNTATFKVYCLNTVPGGSAHFTGYGMKLTAHIITFKDPFSA